MNAKTPSTRVRQQARKLAGQPVCVVLNDGRYYVGRIAGIQNGELVLSGRKGKGKLRSAASSRSRKARISAATFDAPAEGLTSTSAITQSGGFGGFDFGGLNDLMGFMQKAMPMIKMGIGMVKTIMPLLNGFK